MSRKRLFASAALLVIPAVSMIGSGTAFAKSHAAGGSTATCAGTPATVGSTYGVTGSGLPASTMVQFLVSDSSGAESSTTAMTDSSGSASVSGTAWVAGTDKVTITDTSSHWNTLATCSFQVG